MNDDAGELRSLRLAVYVLLISSSLASVTGRICTVRSNDGETPFLSANDRSRWCTISAVVDESTYSIDGVRQRRGWDTIDMVRHAGRDGQQHFYSSKPTLLPTLLAGQYWILRAVTGGNLVDHTFYVARIMLIVTNVLPLCIFFAVLARLVEHHGETTWGRIFVVACATWGTFLTTFAVTLNNHLPAAVSVLICIYCVLRIWNAEDPNWLNFGVAGIAAAFAAANELPALSFLMVITLGLLVKAPKETAAYFLPGVVLVVVAFFGTNYVAHDSWLPPYAHRSVGDNWYDYEGSAWTDATREGIDRGEPSKVLYAVHVLVGHHGIFSLTPIWLLAVAGAAVWLLHGKSEHRFLATSTLLLTVVCLVFYIGLRPTHDRNYGGITSGFRWMFWFTPLWLLCLIPIGDWLSESRKRQILAGCLLTISIFSASYPALNPWVHPWIYTYWQSLGWIGL